MKVRGSIKPPEWDFTSSAVTVYHRTNAVEVQAEDGQIEWEYDETTYTHEQGIIAKVEQSIADVAEVVLDMQVEMISEKMGV